MKQFGATKVAPYVHLCIVLVVAIALSACGGSAPPAPVADEEPAILSVTRWTNKTEVFAEYPPLAAGQTSRFAIHLTRLDSFKPVAQGQVEVHLLGSGAPEIFLADAPSQPGIFGVDVKPARAGKHQLVVVLHAAGLDDEHRVGDLEVHPTSAAARASASKDAEEPPGIGFLKEQQWNLDFGTDVVQNQSVRESIHVPARLDARPGGAADVAAPIDGRLTNVLDATPGTNVARGQELARLLPPPAFPGELPQLERARTEAQSALALATHDRERAERLTTAGAAPQKRLDEARAAEEQARARLAAAEASLAHHHASRVGGAAEGDSLFIVTAPLSGVIAERHAANGANVTAGTTLFRVVDASQIHVVGQIPEVQAARAGLATAAEIEVPGRQDRVLAGPMVTVGKVLDPQSLTLPITFAFDNSVFRLPVGQAVILHLLMAMTSPQPVVPTAAVVDDAGRPIVFVQRDGETFERRPVVLGARAGDLVQITEGVKPGERVVTKGAYLVRLASLSTSVPAHGHVH